MCGWVYDVDSADYSPHWKRALLLARSAPSSPSCRCRDDREGALEVVGGLDDGSGETAPSHAA